MGDRVKFVVLTICITIGLLTVFAGIVISSGLQTQEQSEMAQACVTSGGQWLRDFGAHYECVKP